MKEATMCYFCASKIKYKGRNKTASIRHLATKYNLNVTIRKNPETNY